MNRFTFLAATLGTMAALFSGCAGGRSAGHEPDKAPARGGATRSASDRGVPVLTGAWTGSWQSAYGHHGKLNCRISQIDRTSYRAEFTAYWGLLHGGYEVDLQARPEEAKLVVSGQKDLGKLYGGLYRYQGTISPSHFQADYTAKKDHGVFDLHRVP